MSKEKYYFTVIDDKETKMEVYRRDLIDSLNHKLKETIQSKSNLRIPEQKELFKIFKNYISTKDEYVTVIPDGSFFDLPIDAILCDNSGIFNDINISYASDFSEALNQKKTAIKNPNLTSWSYSSDSTLSSRMKLEISELPIGLEECKTINVMYDTLSFLDGHDLNSNSWISSLSSDIIHVSSHSFSSKSNILGNYITIRNKNKQKPLYGFELKRHDFTDKVVILSSCNSGTGKQQDGTGVFSISRDLFQAGAQTVIKSLWAVNEASTKELMVQMHKNFTNGQSINESLSNAKSTVKRMPGYEHPYYWAGFVLEGNPHVYLDLE